MGRMIPIKFAERDEKPESRYSYSAGESCPKKVLLLRITNRKELSPSNNHKEEICQESRYSIMFWKKC